MHDRTALPGTVYKVQVTCTAEVLDKQHGMKLKEELQQVYGSGFQWINLLPSEDDVNTSGDTEFNVFGKKKINTNCGGDDAGDNSKIITDKKIGNK